MLKIRDDVYLADLEKFGFRYQKAFTPALDENGKIITYHKEKKGGGYTKRKYVKYKEVFGHYLYKVQYEFAEYNFMIDEDRIIMMMPCYQCDLGDDNIYDFDIIYDLIKAGLVEKI